MLSEFDKQLLNAVQGGLPIAPRPFAVLAAVLAVDETAVISRLRFLRENGFIRRLGAYFDSPALGFVSVLAALAVEPEKLPAVARTINEYQAVTHNYERTGPFNLWFTLITAGRDEQEKTLAEIGGLAGVKRLLVLPVIKKYKVDVQFKLK